jgi:YidC/Oxa1 family membrane protein insertase
LDNNRLILAIVVAMALIFGYQQFLQWRYPSLYGPKAKRAGTASPEAGPSAIGPSAMGSIAGILPTPANAPAAAVASGGAAGSGTARTSPSVERSVAVTTNLYTATLSSYGARLVSFRLKKYRETSQLGSPDYEVIRPGDRMPLGMVVQQGASTVDDAAVDYSTSSPPAIEVAPGATATVTFGAVTPDGRRLEKSFSFTSVGYVFTVTARAVTATGTPPDAIGLTMSQPLTELAGYRDYPEIQADINGKALTELLKALTKGVAPVTGNINYAGFGDRYFLAAFLPQHPSNGTLTMSVSGNQGEAQLSFNGASSVTSRVYVGPKALEVLEAVDPALSKAIDLGFWGIIALPFLRALKLFYLVVPNYGIAIILLTVVVRLLTLPMSIRGQRSMMRMQRLQPQVTRLREKFKDDSERLNREMVELYKRNHVNPLGGCLPMVIQFPVFIGLYEALLNAVDLRHAPFVGWINDLSAPDCLHIAGIPAIPLTTCHGIPVLVALMTLSAFGQQWLLPRQPDPSQQRMMMIMPLAFSLIFLSLPSGLSLYYFASNLLGIAQQIVLNREFKQAVPETAT